VNLLPLAFWVMLLWDPIPQAESYRLYVGIQSLRAGNPPLLFYETDEPAYRIHGLDFGTTYYFTVTWICPNGTESPQSNEVVYTPMPPGLAAPITISQWSRRAGPIGHRSREQQ
jgi:hypothetical protein